MLWYFHLNFCVNLKGQSAGWTDAWRPMEDHMTKIYFQLYKGAFIQNLEKSVLKVKHISMDRLSCLNCVTILIYDFGYWRIDATFLVNCKDKMVKCQGHLLRLKVKFVSMVFFIIGDKVFIVCQLIEKCIFKLSSRIDQKGCARICYWWIKWRRVQRWILENCEYIYRLLTERKTTLFNGSRVIHHL